MLGEAREVVFGAQDGIVSTLAVVATVAGATGEPFAIIVAGIAAALAGVFSMAAGEYIGSKSQREIFDAQVEGERTEVEERPGESEAEVAYMLAEEGLGEEDAARVAAIMARHPEVLLRTMVSRELGIQVDESHGGPVQGALFMGAAFGLGAAVPIIPFLVLPVGTALPAAIVLAGIVLFGIGVVKSRLTKRSPIASGAEVLALGGAGRDRRLPVRDDPAAAARRGRHRGLTTTAAMDPRRDIAILFAMRGLRLGAYGGLAVVIALYLVEIGLTPGEVGLLLALTLAGDALVSLLLTTHADRIGRGRTLVIGAALMTLGGLVFAVTGQFAVLLAASIVAVLSPTGNEVGPFLAVEQAALSQVVSGKQRTNAFAWYQLVGAMAAAVGALAAGVVVQVLLDGGAGAAEAYRSVIVGYALIGITIGLLAMLLTRAVEPDAPPADASVRRRLGLHKSQRVVAELSALFALDAFGGGFVVQSVVALWFGLRWDVEPAVLGAIFFGANALAGLSGLVAARLAARFGLIETMVGTHLPSNVMLILVPFMPTLELAIALFVARFAISQMDVPTRQSYTMAVVEPDERSAAAGISGIARTAGAAAGAALAAPLVAASVLGGGLPFVIGGSLKIAYDLTLWRRFRSRRPIDAGEPQRSAG